MEHVDCKQSKDASVQTTQRSVIIVTVEVQKNCLQCRSCPAHIYLSGLDVPSHVVPDPGQPRSADYLRPKAGTDFLGLAWVHGAVIGGCLRPTLVPEAWCVLGS